MAKARTFNLRTPHAAVIVWNYKDRIGSEVVTDANGHTKIQGVSGTNSGAPLADGLGRSTDINDTEKVIISTLSCMSIDTSKSKSRPEGTFQITLAPTRNWVEALVVGSWCCILMSNTPITQDDLRTANKQQVKMIGRIETVRVQTTQDDDIRRTTYLVTGVDWGHIFNNTLYIDNLIAAAGSPQTQGADFAVALRRAAFGSEDGSQQSYLVADNLRSLVNIFGQTLDGFDKVGTAINRLAKSVYNFTIPKDMANYFNFAGSTKSNSQVLNKLLNLVTGSLKGPDSYVDTKEALGYIDPFSLQGTNTFWDILLENSNPALNEMLCELNWDTDPSSNKVALTLYNRIKPFAYKDFTPNVQSKGLKSYFQYIKLHTLNNQTIRSVNTGTNWHDKYNFIEIKPLFSIFEVFANWTKQKVQISDPEAFEREGFRPLIVGTKQFPSSAHINGKTKIAFDPNLLLAWATLMSEWYFDTHRMLNGTVVMTGSSEYIGVGNNIKFDAALINPTPNINLKSVQANKNFSILAHVENVSNSFSVSPDGARTFSTTIQFVRGIIVDSANKSSGNSVNPNVLRGEGTLDKLADQVKVGDSYNRTNTLGSSDTTDPNKAKSKK